MMAAALLSPGVTRLANCPKIADVRVMEKILKRIGAEVRRQGDALLIESSGVSAANVPKAYAGQMRSSIMLLGSLIGSGRDAAVAYPGGCVIGKRPIDLHIDALRKMGAQIDERGEALYARAGGLHGMEYRFEKPSVGALENVIFAAVLAEGETLLSNCAMEPEIVHLSDMLRKMGASIEGAGTPHICIRGVPKLHPVSVRVPPDRIAAGTYVLAAAAAGGEVTLIDAPVQEMGALLQVYQKMGGQYEANSGKLIVKVCEELRPLSYLETEEYPGFPTDLQSMLLAVSSSLDGECRIRERIFEDRFKVVEGLRRMGADIRLEGNCAYVRGKKLHGEKVFAQELRGGAALVLAGLAAEGRTQVFNPQFVERGYENFCGNLTALGAKIRKD